MTHTLRFDLCDICIQRGFLKTPSSLLFDVQQLKGKWVIITQESLRSLYAEPLKEYLHRHGLDISLLTIPPGEQYKTRTTKENLENALFEQGFGKDSGLIALGGGVITDLVGFLAATFCRGIPFISIPTSLLAMVDASVGGKTGVDTPYGKNLIGCYYPPKKIYIDPSVLNSLPKQELSGGLVEVIKHALIAKPSLFHFLETQAQSLLNLEPTVIDRIILENIEIKLHIVEQDRHDVGKRNLLNCGHTVGHALEHLTHYRIAHGEAVALGILMEGLIAVEMNMLTVSEWNRIYSLLNEYGLPLKWPPEASLEALLHTMTLDKKTVQGKPRFVILQEIGSAYSDLGYCLPVEEPLICHAFKRMHEFLV